MSEYISREQFGPLSITVDSVDETSLSVRVAAAVGSKVLIGQHADGTEAMLNISQVPIRHVRAMLEWLRDECVKQLAIRFAIDCAESDLQTTVIDRTKQALQDSFDSAFAVDCSYTLRDPDHMSFQVHQRELKHLAPSDDAQELAK